MAIEILDTLLIMSNYRFSHRFFFIFLHELLNWQNSDIPFESQFLLLIDFRANLFQFFAFFYQKLYHSCRLIIFLTENEAKISDRWELVLEPKVLIKY